MVRSRRPIVLFVCVRNAGRSQMAAGLLAARSDGRLEARSAGSEPAEVVDPTVVAAMEELGIDLAGARPKGLDDVVTANVDVVVTMGCGDACPVIAGARVLDWDLVDPHGLPIEEVRPIRDEIDRRVRELVVSLLDGPERALR